MKEQKEYDAMDAIIMMAKSLQSIDQSLQEIAAGVQKQTSLAEDMMRRMDAMENNANRYF